MNRRNKIIKSQSILNLLNFAKRVHLGICKCSQLFHHKKFVTITYLDIFHFLHAFRNFFKYVTTAEQEYSKAMMIVIFCARYIFSLAKRGNNDIREQFIKHDRYIV